METQEAKSPTRDEMLDALMTRDGSCDGLFFAAVTTTGIFCRPSCPARKPRPQNVEFYGTAREALMAGFRPCSRCRPLEGWQDTGLGERADRDSGGTSGYRGVADGRRR
jgi:AraC family transcriptional regulator, regulatory protein of adaptative response / methylated-DNA-[protein]-cysteine methyltransferase